MPAIDDTAPDAPDASCGAGCGGDPHDHTGHDHGPTGAEIVTSLVRGFSVLTLVVPALILALLVVSLVATPSTPLVLLLGVVLGGLQLGALVATSLVVARSGERLAASPAPLAARSLLEEVLRLATVLTALVMWPSEPRGPLGLWVGAGCAVVWGVLATIQMASARRRLATESAWSTEMVATLLAEGVSPRRTIAVRLADVAGTLLFQVGATVLVAAAPVMVVATTVLSIGTGLSTLVLHRRPPSARVRSPWALVPLAMGVLSVVLAVIAAVSLSS